MYAECTEQDFAVTFEPKELTYYKWYLAAQGEVTLRSEVPQLFGEEVVCPQTASGSRIRLHERVLQSPSNKACRSKSRSR